LGAFIHLKTEAEVAFEMLYTNQKTDEEQSAINDSYFSKSYTIGRALSNWI